MTVVIVFIIITIIGGAYMLQTATLVNLKTINEKNDELKRELEKAKDQNLQLRLEMEELFRDKTQAEILLENVSESMAAMKEKAAIVDELRQSITIQKDDRNSLREQLKEAQRELSEEMKRNGAIRKEREKVLEGCDACRDRLNKRTKETEEELNRTRAMLVSEQGKGLVYDHVVKELNAAWADLDRVRKSNNELAAEVALLTAQLDIYQGEESV